jgi:hypothetical protein
MMGRQKKQGNQFPHSKKLVQEPEGNKENRYSDPDSNKMKINYAKEHNEAHKNYLFIYLFYYSYVHTRLGSFLPPAPTPSLTTHSVPSLSPHTPSISSRNYFALISNFVVERV